MFLNFLNKRILKLSMTIVILFDHWSNYRSYFLGSAAINSEINEKSMKEVDFEKEASNRRFEKAGKKVQTLLKILDDL